MPTSSAKPPARVDYAPRGAAWDLLHSHAPEVVISGPAGTGKSVACLHKLHITASRKPGFRGLMVRKTRRSLTESALVSFETFVLPLGHAARGHQRREGRHSYRYPNGSEVVCGGIDEPSRIMSSEWDMIYVQEAIELSEDEWEALTTRLGRRSVRRHGQQLMGDTNPSAPTHWLKRRCDSKRAVLLESRHEDNPLLYDGADWTAAGRDYIARLDTLTGVRRDRFRFGRWRAAEGQVYEAWDTTVHLIDRAAVPPARYHVAAVDWGYTAPGVLLVFAVDGDGRMYLVHEVYRTKRLIDGWVAEALDVRARYNPEAFVCDPSEPGHVEKFRQAGLDARAADNDRKPGINAVAERLQVQPDGRARLYLVRDCRAERDEELYDAKQPTSTAEEFDTFLWKKYADGRVNKEETTGPDHGQDALRYSVRYVDWRQSAGAGTITSGRRDPVRVPGAVDPRGLPRVNGRLQMPG